MALEIRSVRIKAFGSKPCEGRAHEKLSRSRRIDHRVNARDDALGAAGRVWTVGADNPIGTEYRLSGALHVKPPARTMTCLWQTGPGTRCCYTTSACSK